MSPSLATFILLSGHLFSSSASFLARIELSPGKLSTIKSLAASPIGTTSLDTTALTGYLAIASYSASDTSCGTPLSVQFTALGTCNPVSSGAYSSYTVTSTTVTIGIYSDSLCTTAVKEAELEYKSDTCTEGEKVYVSATSTLTSSVAMVSAR